MGLPTVASNWSATRRSWTRPTRWLIDGKLVPVAADAELFNDLYRGHRWFEADVEHLAATLREIAGARRGAREGRRRPPGPHRPLRPRRDRDARRRRSAEVVRPLRPQRGRTAACIWRGGFGSRTRCASSTTASPTPSSGRRPRAPRARRDRSTSSSRARRSATAGRRSSAARARARAHDAAWEYGDPPRAWVDEARRRARPRPRLLRLHPRRLRRRRPAPGPRRRRAARRRPRPLHARGPGARAALPAAATTFLFVGGTIARKGIDRLIDAWPDAFAPGDDVQLVIKDFGAGTHYDGAGREAARARRDRRAARRSSCSTTSSAPEELPALYRAADVLVAPLPRRGLLPAGARGARLRRAGDPHRRGPDARVRPRRRRLGDPRASASLLDGAVGDLELAGTGYWHEVDVQALAAALRSATDPAERDPRAQAARPSAERFGWDATAARLQAVLASVADEALPIARTVTPAEIPDARGTIVLHVARLGAARPLGAGADGVGPAGAGRRGRLARPPRARRGRRGGAGARARRARRVTGSIPSCCRTSSWPVTTRSATSASSRPRTPSCSTSTRPPSGPPSSSAGPPGR